MKKYLISSFLVFVAAMLLFTGACKHDPVVGPQPPPPPPDECDTTGVTYPGTVFPILDQYCISCHSGSSPSAGLDFTDFETIAVIAQNGALLGSIRHEEGYSPMPQSGDKLSDCIIAKVEIWIRDTTFTEPPPGECDTTNVTYPGTVFPILNQYCISCHSGSSPSAGLDFTDFETIAVIAQNGALLGSIRHEEGYSPMPQSGNKLSDCNIAKVEIWIRDTTFTEPPPGGIPCHPDTVYFQNTILPLLQSSCGITGCHDPSSAQDGVVLTDYFNIIETGDVDPFDPDGSDLYEVLVEDDPDKRMPPPPRDPLTDEQIESVYTWIAQGALDNYCDDLECDTLNVTFSATVWPVIQNRCFGCHSGASPSGGVGLENHAEMVAAVNSGRLMGAIRHEPGFSPMPQNGAKLSDCNISQIQKWINNGMPNN